MHELLKKASADLGRLRQAPADVLQALLQAGLVTDGGCVAEYILTHRGWAEAAR